MNHYYREVPGWFDCPSFYREMVGRCPDGGTIIEVGCWKGRSLACLLVEVVNSGKQISVIGVDHWQGSEGERSLIAEAASTDLLTECRANCERANYPHWQLLTGASTQVAETAPMADVVFIDASHTYYAAKADMLAWVRRVKPGGIIGGHDAHFSGVWRAYTEVFGTVDILEGCWWTTKKGAV